MFCNIHKYKLTRNVIIKIIIIPNIICAQRLTFCNNSTIKSTWINDTTTLKF